VTRAYDNSARAIRARETHTRIVDTATTLLLADGYSAMTVASLAAEAGVSPQTVYNAVGGKAAVVKAVYDRMLAGDEAEVAMSDRPEFRALFDAADLPAFAHAYARWVGLISSRVGPLLGALLAHGTDATLVDLLATIDEERRTGTEHALRGLRDRLGLPTRHRGPKGLTALVDAVWVLNAPEVYDRLVRRRGWTRKRYEEWLAGQLEAALS
jgi:AcrR family transcriptional regulator